MRLKRYLLLVFLFCPLFAYGQGSRKDDVATKNLVTGLAAAPGALITVCTSAGVGVPCTPLANIYSDVGLTSLATNGSAANAVSCSIGPTTNPCLADSNGNYGFYASPGRYVVTVTGAGTTGKSVVYTLACDPSAACTVSGTTTLAGRLNCKNFENTACVDDTNTQGWAGVDICAWIVNAQTSLASTGGALNIYLANGAFAACAGTFNIGSTTQGVRAQFFGAGEIDVQSTVNVAQGSSLLGQNGHSGNLGTTTTIIGAGASFPTSGAYLLQMGPVSGTAGGTSVRDLQLNCKNVALSKGINVSNLQDIGDITGVLVLRCIGNGIDFTGSAQNITVKDTFVLSSASATSDNGFTVGSNVDHITFINAGATSLAASPSSGASFLCNGCNMTILNSHVENHTDGVLLSGSGTNQGAVFIGEMDGLGNVTSLLHIASNWNGTVSAHALRKFLGTNTVKNDLSAFNHTCTDEVVGHYILGANVGQTNPVQLDTDCSVAGSGTMFSIKKAPYAFSGTTAGNFAPDPSVILDIRGPSSTFNHIRLDDITNSTSYYIGPGVGGNFFALRDRVNAKQGFQWAGNTSPLTLPQGVLELAEVAMPGGNAGFHRLAADSATHTPSWNVNNVGTSSPSGAWQCTNVTPVTVNANVATDQNLMACTIPAGTLNRVGRTLRVKVKGIYSTPAASTSQMTLKLKLCTVSGCGSGTVITPISIQSTALGTVQITNDNFSLRSELTTQTAGASSAYEASGEFLIDLSTLATAADSEFGDTNTATVGTIDSTAQLFLQCTFAFSAASASNSATQRQLIAETVN